MIAALLRRIPALKSDTLEATRIVDRCGGTVAGFVRCEDQQRSLYKDMSRQFQATPEQFEQSYRDRFSALAATNPIVEKFTPALDRLRWTQAYQDTERALFRSAIAIQLQGRGVLNQPLDPYDGRPFTFTALKDGFRLESRLKENGVPLMITVN